MSSGLSESCSLCDVIVRVACSLTRVVCAMLRDRLSRDRCRASMYACALFNHLDASLAKKNVAPAIHVVCHTRSARNTRMRAFVRGQGGKGIMTCAV